MNRTVREDSISDNLHRLDINQYIRSAGAYAANVGDDCNLGLVVSRPDLLRQIR